jgi:hypothetical protein
VIITVSRAREVYLDERRCQMLQEGQIQQGMKTSTVIKKHKGIGDLCMVSHFCNERVASLHGFEKRLGGKRVRKMH